MSKAQFLATVLPAIGCLGCVLTLRRKQPSHGPRQNKLQMLSRCQGPGMSVLPTCPSGTHPGLWCAWVCMTVPTVWSLFQRPLDDTWGFVHTCCVPTTSSRADSHCPPALSSPRAPAAGFLVVVAEQSNWNAAYCHHPCSKSGSACLTRLPGETGSLCKVSSWLWQKLCAQGAGITVRQLCSWFSSLIMFSLIKMRMPHNGFLRSLCVLHTYFNCVCLCAQSTEKNFLVFKMCK